MSVIVKGMEMPNHCGECQLDWCYGVCEEAGVFLNFKVRPDWCPLHPLPEKHGRIVDVGPLEVVAYSLSDHEGESFDDGVEFILEKLDALPTIVEEEGD